MATFPWDCSAGNPPAPPRSASPNSLRIQELILLHPPGISRSPNFGKPPPRGCGFSGSRTGKAPVARWAGNCSHPAGNNLGMSVRARAGIPRLLFKRCGSFPEALGAGDAPGCLDIFSCLFPTSSPPGSDPGGIRPLRPRLFPPLFGSLFFPGTSPDSFSPKKSGNCRLWDYPGECRQLPGASCRDRAFGKGAAAPPARVCTQMSNPGIPSQRWKTPHPAAAPGVSPGSSPPSVIPVFPLIPRAGAWRGRECGSRAWERCRERWSTASIPGPPAAPGVRGWGGGAPGIPGKFLSAEFRERGGALGSPDPAGRTALADCWDGKAAAAGGSREIPAAPAATTTPTKPPLSRRE